MLKPEEAGALVAASRPIRRNEPPVDPWYTDIAGWSFLGGGLVTLGFGRWVNAIAEDKQNQADAIRGDSERQQALYRDAQSAKFWSGVATIGGLLLAPPASSCCWSPNTTTHQRALRPRPHLLPGGGGLVLGGRF